MSKLVKAKDWVERYFEPGSEPDMNELEDWVLMERTGQVIGKKLYIYDDALFPLSTSDQDLSISANDLLR